MALSSGCGTELRTWPEDVAHGLNGRRYFVRLPESYNPTRKHSLVLSFHGMASAAQDAPFFRGKALVEEDVIFVFPEGLNDAPSKWRSWNGSGSVGSPGPAGPTCIPDMVPNHPCYSSCEALGGCRDPCWLTTCADDVGFVAALLRATEEQYCVDTADVHAIGFSAGGWLALELGTNSLVAHRFRSIVTIASVPFRGFNRAPALLPGASYLGIYGRSDTLVPAFPNTASGLARASSGWLFESWESMSEVWSASMGCQSGWKKRAADGLLQCQTLDCDPNSLALCFWDGPHAVPEGALDLAWRTFFPGSSNRWSASAEAQHKEWLGLWLGPMLRVGAALALFLALPKLRWMLTWMDPARRLQADSLRRPMVTAEAAGCASVQEHSP